MVIVLAICICLYFLKEKIYIFLEPEPQYPFKRKEFLMNIPERRFFEGLQQILPANYVVFPQVVLSSIVSVSDRNEFWKYQNKINRKTIDFVIFERPYYKPVLGIEYDGKTHQRPHRMERDNAVKHMLEAAGIKSMHVPHQENINFDELRSALTLLLSNKSS